MKTTTRQFVLVAIIVLLIAGFFTAYIMSFTQKTSVVEIITDAGNVSVLVEVADTPEKWSRGLMFRTYLNESSGMFFVFSSEQERSFWMKNTLIPLDIIFISSNFTIVDIKENFAPCQKDTCETYKSMAPAQYVLEVNAGFASRNNVSIRGQIREI